MGIFHLMLIRTRLGPLVPKVSANLLITLSPGPAPEYNSSHALLTLHLAKAEIERMSKYISVIYESCFILCIENLPLDQAEDTW